MADDARPEAFDPDALRDKYRAERDKRLRTEGNEQYVNMAGDFVPVRGLILWVCEN